MAVNKGVIVWRGDLGSPPNNFSKTTIEGVSDDAALATLAGVMSAHSDCNPARRSFNAVTAMTNEAPGVSANVDEKGLIYFQDPTNLHTLSTELPAPKSTSREEIAGTKFERLTETCLSDIVTAINTATGNSYTALYGKVIQR
jgi:hypothetical protein